MKILRAKQLDNEKGVALFELALIAPVIIVILLAGLELSRSLHLLQLSATLSREASSMAYRRCLADEPPKTEKCLEEVHRRLQAQADNILAGTQIIISAYEYKAASYSQLGSVAAAGDYQTKFSTNGTSISGNIDNAVVRSQQRVVIGETYVPFDPIIPGIMAIFGADRRGFYDATIM